MDFQSANENDNYMNNTANRRGVYEHPEGHRLTATDVAQADAMVRQGWRWVAEKPSDTAPKPQSQEEADRLKMYQAQAQKRGLDTSGSVSDLAARINAFDAERNQ